MANRSSDIALVTGAAGFIGSHLCEALLARGMEVVGVDALTRYYDVAQKQENLRAVFDHPQAARFRFVASDLMHLDLNDVLKDTTHVYHLAAEPGVRKSWGKDFMFYLERNIASTQRLLEHCRGSKSLKRFVFASSSSVYGESKGDLSAPEQLCRPYSPYGVTKLAAENLCLLYADNFGVPCVALRLFTVFGARQRPDMAFHRFMRAAIENRPLIIFGDGKQSRDFTAVEDVVAAFVAAGESGKNGEIYNVSGGAVVSLTHVLDTLRTLVAPLVLNIRYEKAVEGDVRHTRGDIKKTLRDLGYTPRITLENGLQREWEWLKSALSSQGSTGSKSGRE